MSRAKMWAMLAGMVAGLVAGPGCMMFDDYCDDQCLCDQDSEYPGFRPDLKLMEGGSPRDSAQPRAAVP